MSKRSKSKPLHLSISDMTDGHPPRLFMQGHALVVLFLRKSEAFDAEFVLGVGKCAMSSSGWGCFQKMMLR